MEPLGPFLMSLGFLRTFVNARNEICSCLIGSSSLVGVGSCSCSCSFDDEDEVCSCEYDRIDPIVLDLILFVNDIDQCLEKDTVRIYACIMNGGYLNN